MFRRYTLLAVMAMSLLALPALAGPRGTFGEFRELSIIFELNDTDQDAEVVIFAKAFEGMDRFRVTDPMGLMIIDLTAKDREDIGQGQLLLESAEPSVEEVKDAFPEGMYQFEARTVSGESLFGTAVLTHTLLPPPAFSPDDEDVDADDVVVEWSSVPGAAAYVVEVEQDDLGVSLTATLTPDVSSFNIPEGFLLPGMEYQLGMATITPAGNVTVAEAEFTTKEDSDDEDGDDEDD